MLHSESTIECIGVNVGSDYANAEYRGKCEMCRSHTGKLQCAWAVFFPFVLALKLRNERVHSDTGNQNVICIF